jgi:hypothetical protein
VSLARCHLAASLPLLLWACQAPSPAAVAPAPPAAAASPAPAPQPAVASVPAPAPAPALAAASLPPAPQSADALAGPSNPPRLLNENTRGHSQQPRMGQAALRERFLTFPRALTPIISMGDQMVALQTPLTLAYFDTRATAVEVLEFYARDFTKKRYSWVGLNDAKKLIEHPAISATDPNDDTQMTVMVMGGGKGQPNTVILGLADVRPAARVPDEGDLPPYPGATPLVVRSTESGGTGYTLAFATDDPPKKVADFFRERLPQLGYAERVVEAAGAGTAIELAYTKRGRRWMIRVNRQTNQTAVVALCAAEEVQP